MIFFTGAGGLVCFGLLGVMLTEEALRAITHNPSITAPRSWWLMCGYGVAAFYCVVLYFVLRFRDRKSGAEYPGRGHTLFSLPVWCWSLGYLLLGVLRVMSPK